MSTLDVIVLLPVIPALPILVTCWLPWERWIPWSKIPKALLGPYILYAAFAAAYFKFDPWIAVGTAVIGAALSIWAVVEKRHRNKFHLQKEQAKPTGNGS